MTYSFENAVTYHYGKFPPSELKYELIINDLINATDSLARFDQKIKNLHNSELFIAPLRSQEAVLSSRIEGTISTIDEVLEFENKTDDELLGSARADLIETILYQRALKSAQIALENGYPFSISFIKQMHQQLLFFGRGALKSPGEFKKEQNYLVDRGTNKIQFIPVTVEKLIDGLEKLFDYIENDSTTPLIKTGIAHLEFEALHPFQDGNGRIGRMMITLLLWKFNVLSQPYFYISGYLEENKDEYIDVMRRVSQYNDWHTWIRFFLRAVEQQANKNLLIAESIKNLYEKMKVNITESLSSKWNLVVLDFLFTHPVFRNNKMIKETDIPPATAAGMIKKLMDQGYLVQKEIGTGRKSSLYSFEPLMEIIRV